MYDVPADELVVKTGSIFKLVIIAARRAVELSDGAEKLVDSPRDMKLASVALKEILEDKVTFKIKGAE